LAASPAQPQSILPLYVDLDGTLIKTDLLLESLFLLLKKNPLYILVLPIWLLDGRAELKAKVAARVSVNYELLPLNTEFLSFLRSEKAKGRHLVLITASNESAVAAFAQSLNLFDEVVGSDAHTNLKSKAKLQRINEMNTNAPFAYAGNAAADLLIWQQAQELIRVNCSKSLGQKLATADKPLRDFDTPGSRWPRLWQAMRPHQWLKNGLLFIPLVLAHELDDMHALQHAIIGILCFCLLASSIYLLNDLLDLEADRRHASKRSRPLAAGELPIQHGAVAAIVLFVAALLLAHLQPLAFVEALGAYWLLTLFYSFLLKRIFLLDLFSLASLYTLRLIAGAGAAGVIASPWLLVFSMALFFGLGAVKRVTELVNRGNRETNEGNQAASLTLPGRAYTRQHLSLLTLMGTSASTTAVLVFLLYIYAEETVALYSSPLSLWPIVGLLGLILFRVWRFAIIGKLQDDPVLFAISDRPSQIATALMFLVLWLAI
jgi:4-hydroxybenzoate polyprenyltransferase